MEKMLTSDEKEMARFMTSSPESAVSEEERTQREAYHYSKVGITCTQSEYVTDSLPQARSLLMRSQLDCKDGRLPGKGTFDIKTRAALVIRHDRANWEVRSGMTADSYKMN